MMTASEALGYADAVADAPAVVIISGEPTATCATSPSIRLNNAASPDGLKYLRLSGDRYITPQGRYVMTAEEAREADFPYPSEPDY